MPDLFKLIMKRRLSNDYFEFLQNRLKIASDMPCCRRVFKPTFYLTINAVSLVEFRKIIYDVYDTDSFVLLTSQSKILK